MPINENIKVEVKEKAEYPPLPEKIYQVELLDITMEKRATYDTRLKPDNEKEYENVLSFQFTLLNGKDKEGKALRGRNIWENFVPMYLYIGKNGKNKLYRITEAILGHELTPEEQAIMDTQFLNGLISEQCQVVVKNERKGDKIYDRIESFVASDNNDLEGLNEEEKENARVKVKKGESFPT
jgi:hypothetical protein